MTEEDDKIMLVKSDRKMDKVTFKVRKRVKNSFVPNEYFKTVNIKDSNDLSLLFEDLNLLLSAPIEKAFRKYMERKTKGFPF
jgi:acyl-CoA synthetase (AMP-forming)/AMP-acid ligase II